MSDSVRGLRLDSRSLTAAAYEGQVGFFVISRVSLDFVGIFPDQVCMWDFWV